MSKTVFTNIMKWYHKPDGHFCRHALMLAYLTCVCLIYLLRTQNINWAWTPQNTVSPTSSASVENTPTPHGSILHPAIASQVPHRSCCCFIFYDLIIFLPIGSLFAQAWGLPIGWPVRVELPCAQTLPPMSERRSGATAAAVAGVRRACSELQFTVPNCIGIYLYFSLYI